MTDKKREDENDERKKRNVEARFKGLADMVRELRADFDAHRDDVAETLQLLQSAAAKMQKEHALAVEQLNEALAELDRREEAHCDGLRANVKKAAEAHVPALEKVEHLARQIQANDAGALGHVQRLELRVAALEKGAP